MRLKRGSTAAKLATGVAAWLATGAGAFATYLTTLGGDLSLYNPDVILTGAVGWVATGLGTLAEFLRRWSKDRDNAEVLDEPEVIENRRPVNNGNQITRAAFAMGANPDRNRDRDFDAFDEQETPPAGPI